MPTIASIDKLFTQATELKAMPGIVAVAATDTGIVYEGAFGKRELGKDAPMTVDSVVWIASMTSMLVGGREGLSNSVMSAPATKVRPAQTMTMAATMGSPAARGTRSSNPARTS